MMGARSAFVSLIALSAVGCFSGRAMENHQSDRDASAEHSCGSARVLCGDRCVDLAADTEHCGSCNHPCGAGTTCLSGACTPSCPREQIMCAGTCVDADPQGDCPEISCPGALTFCDDKCVDVLSSSDHCGECAVACGTLGACQSGTCRAFVPRPVHVPWGNTVSEVGLGYWQEGLDLYFASGDWIFFSHQGAWTEETDWQAFDPEIAGEIDGTVHNIVPFRTPSGERLVFVSTYDGVSAFAAPEAGSFAPVFLNDYGDSADYLMGELHGNTLFAFYDVRDTSAFDVHRVTAAGGASTQHFSGANVRSTTHSDEGVLALIILEDGGTEIWTFTEDSAEPKVATPPIEAPIESGVISAHEDRWILTWTDAKTEEDFFVIRDADGTWSEPTSTGTHRAYTMALIEGELQQIGQVQGLVSSSPQAFGSASHVAHTTYREGAWTAPFIIDDGGRGSSVSFGLQHDDEWLLVGREGGEVYWTASRVGPTWSKPYYLTDPETPSLFLSDLPFDVEGIWPPGQRPLLATADQTGVTLWVFP